MKCARPNCPNNVKPGRDQGLCSKHYQLSPLRGYVPADRTRERLALLRSRGITVDMLVASGVSTWGQHLIETNERVQRSTEAKVLGIPVPTELIPTGAYINGVGTRRRLQALVAIGWTQRLIGQELGVVQSRVKALTHQDGVTARVAFEVRDVFDRLSMTIGPSNPTRIRAAAKGWLPPLAWDDIDNPDEVPDLGADRRASFMERYEEFRDHIGLADRQIAERMGIQLNSLQVAISREKRKRAA